jgi:hypothetical protein
VLICWRGWKSACANPARLREGQAMTDHKKTGRDRGDGATHTNQQALEAA